MKLLSILTVLPLVMVVVSASYFEDWVSRNFGVNVASKLRVGDIIPVRALADGDTSETCPALDDPNTALNDYSYDFLFADGSRVFGTSDKNTVDVTVAGKTFELHISCSDQFENGYGDKGGPVQGVNPKVTAWRIWKYKDADKGIGSCKLSKTCGPGGAGPPEPPGCYVEPRCTDVEDPNQVAMKQTYEFFFADGTYITGASDSNTVVRTVAGKSVELHISCSDEFENGYGTKGGPVEGVNPEVLWFQIWKYKDTDKGQGSCFLSKTCYGPC